MTFKRILFIAKQNIERSNKGFRINILHLVVNNNCELAGFKRAFAKYKKDCQALIDNNDFYMPYYDDYCAICRYIDKVFDNALILHNK